MNLKDILEGHEIYRKYSSYWDFLLSSYEGGVNYSGAYIINGSNPSSLLDSLFRVFANGKEISSNVHGNLFMHPKERTQDYAERVRMSYYYNFCAPVIDIYTNHLFKQEIVNKFKSIQSEVDEIYEDVDCNGSSLPEFRRKVADMAQVYGHVFIVVDSPALDEKNIISRKDQIENRAFPYFSIYTPSSLINWSLDKFGNPYWVILAEPNEVNTDPETYDKNKKKQNRFRLWTREEWFLFEGETIISSGTHGLGIVPIVCAYDKKSNLYDNYLGVSAIADICFIARDIYNSCSELKQILRDQTFAFLAVQGTSDEYRELSVGTSKGLLYPEGRNAPQYVAPPSSNADIYFQHIDRQVSKIFQLAKLEGGSVIQPQQSAVMQSGVSKAWDFNETNSSLTCKSNNLEDAEMKMWQIFALWLNKEFDGTVQYPKEFSVSSLKDDMNEAEQSARLALGDTYQLEVLKSIQKKRFPSATPEEIDVMAQEAEEEITNRKQLEQGNQPMGGLNLRSRMPFLFNKNANSAAKGGNE